MLCKYTQTSSNLGGAGETCWKALIANANIGGENVHRGAVLGAILGARAGDENLPTGLKSGLYEKDAIAKEIDLFIVAVMQKAELKGGANMKEYL